MRWLRTGLLQIPYLANTPLDKTDVLVQIPTKYGRLLDKNHALVALIDEVIGISKLTPDLTHEFSARLRNLGESWLPISYRAEWLSEIVAAKEPVISAGEETPPHRDNYGTDAAVKREDTLDLFRPPGQDQSISHAPDKNVDLEAPPSVFNEQSPATESHSPNDALAPQSSNAPSVQANGGLALPTPPNERQTKQDETPGLKGRKRSSAVTTEKKAMIASSARKTQSSLLPGGDSTSDQHSEDAHD